MRYILVLLTAFICLHSPSQASEPSSITDDGQYPQFFKQAASDEAVFDQFRSHPICEMVVEAVTPEFGQKYLDLIKEQAPELLQEMERFKKGDLIGHPKTASYEGVGDISPTTLRYIKVAADLKKLYGSLDGLSIIEIGGGYGGQCKILADLFHFKKYTIIDLPGPLALAKKFLEKHGVRNVCYLSDQDAIPDQEYDLIISNYAFSEINFELQKKYIKNVLAISKKGYLTCNQIADFHDRLKKEKFVSKHKLLKTLTKASIDWKELPETPLTFEKNYLIIWDNK